MNTKYYKWYLSIIENRKINVINRKQMYCEKHHVIPKSCGGTNEKENLVFLTAREHFVCHELLVFHFRQIKNKRNLSKMMFAWNRMVHDGKHGKINSRIYQSLKILQS